MDLDDIRTILRDTGLDIWGLIETAIKVASLDYKDELRVKRDGIVEKLYRSTNCHNCERICNGFGTPSSVVAAVFGSDGEVNHKSNSPSTPGYCGGDGGHESEHEHEDEDKHESEQEEKRDVYENVDDEDEDDELRRIYSIKKQIDEDLNQSEDSLVDLLQSLSDMDITFKALEKTDIGRHVNQLKKHSSSDVRRLVKLLVRKWKDLVDEWVKSNTHGEVKSSNNLIADGDSPQQNVPKNHRNDNHNQVPDFAYSPNPRNGSSGSDKNNSELEPKRKVPLPPRRDPPVKPMKRTSPASAPPPNRQKEVLIDPDRLASARKRLQENYQEAKNAKKQRTIQVMDIHEIPKPRNGFFGRNKGGFQRH